MFPSLIFNITLKNFIHDKLNKVDEEFPLGNFIIINYHQFINAELNNLGVVFEVPDDLPKSLLNKYLETNYYGNTALFEKYKASIIPYDAVLIDEIQDYHRTWMDIIKNYYRDPEGDPREVPQDPGMARRHSGTRGRPGRPPVVSHHVRCKRSDRGRPGQAG